MKEILMKENKAYQPPPDILSLILTTHDSVFSLKGNPYDSAINTLHGVPGKILTRPSMLTETTTCTW